MSLSSLVAPAPSVPKDGGTLYRKPNQYHCPGMARGISFKINLSGPLLWLLKRLTRKD